MRRTIKAIAFLAGFVPAVAAAQVPNFPQTLPANTLVGRTGIGPGPAQAIPFDRALQIILSTSNPLPIANGGTGAATAAGARTNLGLGTAAVANTGTNGHNLPFLDGTNIWSGNNTLSHSGDAVQLGIPTGDRLTIVQGNSLSPVITDTPTLLVSRSETLPSPGSVANTAIYAVSVGNLGSVPQTTAINGYAYQLGSGDVLGVGGRAEIHTVAGSTHAAIALAGEARAYANGSSAQGVEFQVHNEANAAAYFPDMISKQIFSGVDINYFSPSGLLGSVAVLIRADTGKWDVGIGFNTFNGFGPTVTADIQTDSSATNILLANSGAHTNGINLFSSTFSANAYLSPGASISGVGVATFSGLKILGSTLGTFTIAVPAVAGTNTLTLPAGTTNFTATGGTSQVVKQTTSGGAFTVARLACSDLSDSSTGCSASSITALTGDVTATGPGSVAATLATVNSNVGSFGSATQAPQITVNGKGLITAASNITITPAVGSITGLGTGVATALGINVGTAGSPVVNGGALGTPSSGTLTSATGLPIATGVSGLGTGVATFLATPSSANLRAALTDETGTGAAFFAGGNFGAATGTSVALTALSNITLPSSVIQLAAPTPTAFLIVDGSSGTAQTTNAPTFLVSRYEQFSGVTTVGPAIRGITIGNNTGISQATAVEGTAWSLGSGDALGIGGAAEAHGTGAGIGGFFFGTAAVSGSAAIAIETQTTNSTGSNNAYSATVGANRLIGLDISYGGGSGANYGAAAIQVRAGNAPWDVGLGFMDGNFVRTATIQDNTQSNTLIKDRGAHTTGIDFGGTYSGNMITSTNFTVTSAGAIGGVSEALVGGGYTSSRSDGNYQYQAIRTGTNANTYGMAVTSTGDFSFDDVTGGAQRFKIVVSTGQVIFPTAISSTTATTGAIVALGGMGVVGNLNVGGAVGVTGALNTSGNITLSAAGVALYINATSGLSNLVFQSAGVSKRFMFVDSSEVLVIANAAVSAGVQLATSGATSWTAYSDRRVKSDVKTFTVLDKLDSFRATSFTNNLTGVREIGIIAQEQYAQFPELIHRGTDDIDGLPIEKMTDPRLWGTTYDRWGVIALQGVKEVWNNVDGRIAALRADNDNLRSEIEKLRRANRR